MKTATRDLRTSQYRNFIAEETRPNHWRIRRQYASAGAPFGIETETVCYVDAPDGRTAIEKARKPLDTYTGAV